MPANAYLISFPVNFKLSRFRIIYSHHLVVTLTTDGLTGVGAGVLYRSTGATVMQAWRNWLHKQLASLKLDTLESTWESLVTQMAAIEPGLAFAVDSALWDLKGQREGCSVATLLGGIHHNPIPITEQIFIDEWKQSQAELGAILNRGTTRLKIKTGFSTVQDIELVKKVRDFAGENVEIRVDANRAYSFDESVEMYKKLADLGVLAVEEPIRYQDINELRRFREVVGLPVMLDETVLSLTDLKQAIEAKAIDSLNIKLTRVGGLSQALAYRRTCEEAGIAVSLGCNEDLGSGMASILHMAAATASLYSTEGIGRLRLGVDLTTEEMQIKNGNVSLPEGTGLGIHLHPDFPDYLGGHAHIFDLSSASPLVVGSYSHYFRNRQRAATALYRLRRNLV